MEYGHCVVYPFIFRHASKEVIDTEPISVSIIPPSAAFVKGIITLGYFSPAIEVERIGLGIHWRRGLEVMFRLQGAGRPV